MEWGGVVADGGDALVFELLVEGVWFWGEDGVLCVDGGVFRGYARGLYFGGAGENLVVAYCDGLAEFCFFVEDIQFAEEDGGLNGVEASVDAEEGVVVFLGLAVDSDLAHALGEVVVVGEKGSAVAVAAEGLRGKEGCAADGGESAGAFAVVGGAEALGGVFDHG